MPIFTTYDSASREIVKTELATDLADAQANAGAGHVTVAGAYYPAHTWFPHDEPVEKAEMAIARVGRTISGLPDSCIVLINGVAPSTVTGGTFTFDADHVGAKITAPGFVDAYVLTGARPK